jgi:hypothetical protein
VAFIATLGYLRAIGSNSGMVECRVDLGTYLTALEGLDISIITEAADA